MINSLSFDYIGIRCQEETNAEASKLYAILILFAKHNLIIAPYIYDYIKCLTSKLYTFRKSHPYVFLYSTSLISYSMVFHFRSVQHFGNLPKYVLCCHSLFYVLDCHCWGYPFHAPLLCIVCFQSGSTQEEPSSIHRSLPHWIARLLAKQNNETELCI